MKKEANVDGARAVHVQVFSMHHFLAVLRDTRVAPPIPIWTRPTWRRMKKGAGVHCARAVHVQCFAPVVLLPPLQATRYARLMPNLQVTCMLPQHICFCGYRSFEVQAARARTGKVYLGGVLWF